MAQQGSIEEVLSRFDHVTPTAEQEHWMEQAGLAIRRLVHILVVELPRSREQSVALTELESVSRTINHAITHGGRSA